MQKVSLGELTAHVTGGSDGNGGGAGPVVVLLHGFGAPGTDLVSLAREMAVPKDTRFVFPMAPLALEDGPSDMIGRAWWMIDMAALQVAAMTRHYDALVKRVPEGMSEARRAIESMLDALEAELGPAPALFLGGFSQGAMLAIDTVLRSDRKFTGLVILSGALLAEDEWTAHAPSRRDLPVFQSHGRSDPILPYPVAEMLRDRLATAGLAVRFLPFSGGHGIPRDVLRELSSFIDQHGGRAS